jgi:uncharacterized protein with NRDE domain
MCVVAAAVDAHPRWAIVLAGNRDEFHARASAPLARWEDDDSHIIAGRDLVSGGTWLGVCDEGRIAVVTNIRTGAPPDPAKASRGALVADYLRGKGIPDIAKLDRFNAFSLIIIGPEGATLIANRPAAMIERMPPGIYGLSNGAPHKSWPRKERLLAMFGAVIDTATDLPDALLNLLSSESIDDSIFIRDDIYGTRCSTVVLVDRHGAGLIAERRFGPDGLAQGETMLRFDCDGIHSLNQST